MKEQSFDITYFVCQSHIKNGDRNKTGLALRCNNTYSVMVISQHIELNANNEISSDANKKSCWVATSMTIGGTYSGNKVIWNF